MRHITTVITYQHAYVPGETSLCQHHAEQPPAWVPALGPVSHGEHAGACEACEPQDSLLVLATTAPPGENDAVR